MLCMNMGGVDAARVRELENRVVEPWGVPMPRVYESLKIVWWNLRGKRRGNNVDFSYVFKQECNIPMNYCTK
jgi:hypothetical protein